MLKFVLLTVCFHSILVFSQKKYPQNYFRPPVDSVLLLNGNFGELRNNHFHAGLDIKTQNREGVKIFAVADGYVSRIKISATGYGKCIYITHPNGYVSVYAHLSGYEKTIADFINKSHYKIQSYEMDMFPQKTDLQVKKGDLIAFSGNTGGSSGPHLHFEIRDEKTEKAINPLLFGFPVPDHEEPLLSTLAIYPLSSSSTVNGSKKAQKIPLGGKSGNISTIAQAIVVNGAIGFGIEAYDCDDAFCGKNTSYSIELLCNNKRIYYHEMEEIGFDESRAINCHLDYPEKRVSGKNIQRSFVLKNNPLGIYKNVLNNGIIDFETDSIYKMKYIVKDIEGNTSVVNFVVKGIAKKNVSTEVKSNPKFYSVFHCNDTNHFQTKELEIILPPKTLYEDIRFEYSSKKDSSRNFLSAIHQIHNENTPVHSYYNIAIKPNKPIADSLRQKAFIVLLDSKAGRKNEGGEWENGFIKTKTKNFGNFAVLLDVTKPSIKPINIKTGKNIARQGSIQIKVADNLTGIKTYNGYIDGKWILFEYEPKKNLLIHYIDPSLKKGKHQFKIEVGDGRGNINTFQCTLLK